MFSCCFRNEKVKDKKRQEKDEDPNVLIEHSITEMTNKICNEGSSNNKSLNQDVEQWNTSNEYRNTRSSLSQSCSQSLDIVDILR